MPSEPRGIYNTQNQSVSGMLNQSMPLAAIFLRNKFLAWFAVVQGCHYVWNTDKEQVTSDSLSTTATGLDKSPITRLLIAFTAIIVCYMDFVFPQK